MIDHPLKVIQLNTYRVSGSVLGTGDTAVNTVDKTPAFKNFPFWRIETDVLKVSGIALNDGLFLVC